MNTFVIGWLKLDKSRNGKMPNWTQLEMFDTMELLTTDPKGTTLWEQE